MKIRNLSFSLSILFMLLCIQISAQDRVGMIGIYNSDDFPYVECLEWNDGYRIKFRDDNNLGSSGFDDEFELSKEAYEAMLKEIEMGFENPPKESIELETKEGYVTIEFQKHLGVVAFRFTTAKSKKALGVNYSTWIRKKDLSKLFGV